MFDTTADACKLTVGGPPLSCRMVVWIEHHGDTLGWLAGWLAVDDLKFEEVSLNKAYILPGIR